MKAHLQGPQSISPDPSHGMAREFPRILGTRQGRPSRATTKTRNDKKRSFLVPNVLGTDRRQADCFSNLSFPQILTKSDFFSVLFISLFIFAISTPMRPGCSIPRCHKEASPNSQPLGCALVIHIQKSSEWTELVLFGTHKVFLYITNTSDIQLVRTEILTLHSDTFTGYFSSGNNTFSNKGMIHYIDP